MRVLFKMVSEECFNILGNILLALLVSDTTVMSEQELGGDYPSLM